MTEYWALVDRHKDKEAREYIRAGTIAAAIYNVNRDPKKHPAAITAADIFPGIAGLAKEQREATPAEIDMFFQGVVARHGGGTAPRLKVPRSEFSDLH